MHPLMQGYKLQQLLQVMETIYVPHVESGQHEAMLFTVWSNPQIILITAIINKIPQMNIYVIIAIGNRSIQDSSHLAPMNTLAPEWLS